MSQSGSWQARFLFFSIALVLVALAACDSAARPPSLLYIGWDEDGRNQVFRLDEPGGAPEQLTFTDVTRPADVFDFALSPDGRTIAYSVLFDEAGSAIRLISRDGGDPERLLDCPDAECSGLAWAPDGRRVAYERRQNGGGAALSPVLYWLDTHSQETLPLVAGDATPSYGARFSPVGGWLGYVSLPDEGVVVYRERDGAQSRLGSYTGMPPAWSLDGRLVVSDLSLDVLHGDEGDDHSAHSHDYRSAVRLYVVDDPAKGDRRQLSPDAPVDDGAPAWSPDGEWIAFGRRQPDTAGGRQLWLIREDGRDERPLTDDQAIHHGPPAWSPDGALLLHQRVEAFDPDARPSLWTLDVNSGEEIQWAAEGFQPVWLAR